MVATSVRNDVLSVMSKAHRAPIANQESWSASTREHRCLVAYPVHPPVQQPLDTVIVRLPSSLDPSAAFTYINTALEYHNQTLTPFRHAIDDINPQNSDAVFAHSVVTTIICIALPRHTAEKDENIGAYEKIVLATELLQGVSKILNLYRGWVTLKPFTYESNFWGNSTTALDQDTEIALNNLSMLTDEVSNSEQRNVFHEAVKLLRQCFVRYANSRDIASILAWLAAADKGFVHALRCRHPLALLILMHWGVLIHELDGRLWWAQNSGSALVLELLVELQSYQPRWKNILLWPKQKIGLERHLVHSRTTHMGTPH
ncbi:hypothetical protein AN5349.2 [Aspergillus nidulans FGSC A4]|uniref:C6 transcription factor, putative (AFU_orthologue AFUA_6G14150) n=1 Tax=Emericella nidulans (strain FGSC A4 / ATCC 38163 / CBS 112.46 / NRRL 194 / M139) TaxID=227321 RepID=Q5B281_EMENI|nr:hypothetical protein [Aspergillus nidulans FGSC A4]EAA62509.1 hypothetical protein AN5349.2 [Aspergillus nidulans FGSC A4]CBF82058.1 TPA: C6 transcription factor, putative (AFU_orthologue; AFUA_6G14150) [Aspergillus nidulans FGSC A4]|eukprot:XP_662953.1 hypothetical protein AN5349.2 [Aspergillus nidulans FGSC A4]